MSIHTAPHRPDDSRWRSPYPGAAGGVRVRFFVSYTGKHIFVVSPFCLGVRGNPYKTWRLCDGWESLTGPSSFSYNMDDINLAEVERLVAEKRGCPACRSLYPDLAAEAARVASRWSELDALLETRARAAREAAARISRGARAATGDTPVGEGAVL